MPNNKGSTNKSNNRNIKINSKWLKNSLRSLGLASTDALKEIMPATMGTASSAATVAKDAITDIKKNNINAQSVSKAIKNNPVVKMGNEWFKNALEDLKTGNLYNTERDPLGGALDGLDNLEDVSFGDMDEGSTNINNINIETGDSGYGEATLKAIQDSSERQVKSTEIMTNTMVSLASTSMLNANKIGSDIVSELTNISGKLDSMIEYNNSNMTKFIEASISYYDQATGKKDESPGSTKITGESLFAGGGLNLNTYKDFIKQNFKDLGDNNLVASMIKMVVENKGMFTSNPIGGLMTLAITSAIPSSIKATLEAIDTGVKDRLTSLLDDIGSWGQNDYTFNGMLKQMVGSIFGTKTRFKNTANVRNIDEGPMQYNGIANHTITEIIPKYLRESTEYLRVIAEKITGQKSADMKLNTEVFDREKNRFTTLRKIREDTEQNYLDQVGNSFSSTSLYKVLVNEIKKELGSDDDTLKSVRNVLGNKLSQQQRKISTDELQQLITNSKGLDPEVVKLLNKVITEGYTNDKIVDANGNPKKLKIDDYMVNAARVQSARGQNRAMDDMRNGKNAQYLDDVDQYKRISELYGDTIFGEEYDPKKAKEASEKTDKLFEMLKGNLSEKFSVIKSAAAGTIYAPMLEKIEGIAGGLADVFKEKIWDPLSIAIFGEKADNGYVKGGMLSGVTNGILDMFNQTKFLITGIPYTDSKNQLHDDTEHSVFGKIKSDFNILLHGKAEVRDENDKVIEEGKLGLIGSFKSGFEKLTNGFYVSINNWRKALTGDNTEYSEEDIKNNKPVEDGKKQFNEILNKVKNVLPGGIAGGVTGGIIGTLVGGPVVGSLIGFSTGIISQSESLKKILFGKDAEYNEDGSLKESAVEGLISDKTKKWFKDNKENLALGTGVGLVGTLVGGPLTGALLGFATTIGKSEGIFHRFLFGDREHGIKGLNQIWKEAVGKFNVEASGDEENSKFLGMTALSSGLTGGLMGLAFGPGGLIGGSILGLGASILAQKDNFHDWLFGKDTEIDGKTVHKEGILGQFKNMFIANVGTPLKNAALEISDNFKTWLEYDVLDTFKLAAEPLLNGFFTGLSKLTGTVIEGAEDLGRFIKEDFLGNIVETTAKILSPLTTAVTTAAKAVGNVAMKVAAAPIKLLAMITGPIGQAVGAVTGALVKTADLLLVKPLNLLVIKPLATVANAAGKIIAAPFNLLNKVAEKVADKVNHFTAFIGAIVDDAVTKVTDGIKAVGAKIAETVFAPIKKLGAMVKTAGAVLLEMGKSILIEIKDTIKDTFTSTFKKIAGVIFKPFKAIGESLFGNKEGNKEGLGGYLKKKWYATRDGFDRSKKVKDQAGRVKKTREEIRAERKQAAKERKDRAYNQKLIAKHSKNQLLADTEENRKAIEAKLGKAIEWKGDPIVTKTQEATIKGNEAELSIKDNTERIINFLTNDMAKTNAEMLESMKSQENLQKNQNDAAKAANNVLRGKSGFKFGKFVDKVKTDLKNAASLSRANGEKGLKGLYGTLKNVAKVGWSSVKGAASLLKSDTNTYTDKHVNFRFNGVSWDVLDIKTGKKKRELSDKAFQEYKSRKNLEIVKHAKGTDNAPGGPSIVGEEGQEIIMSPNKATLSNIVPGSKVISNGDTEDLIDATVETSNVMSDIHDKGSNAIRVTLAEKASGILDKIKGTFKSLFGKDSSEDENDETAGKGYSDNSDDTASIADAGNGDNINTSAISSILHGDKEVFDNTAANVRAEMEAKKDDDLNTKAKQAQIDTAKYTARVAEGEEKKESFFSKVIKFVTGGGLGTVLKGVLLALGLAGIGKLIKKLSETSLPELVSSALDTAVDIGAKIAEGIGNWWKETAWPGIKKGAGKLKDWWTDKAWPAITKFIDTLPSKIWDLFSSGVGAIGDAIHKLFKGDDRGDGDKSGKDKLDDYKDNVKRGNILQLDNTGQATGATDPAFRLLTTQGIQLVGGMAGVKGGGKVRAVGRGLGKVANVGKATGNVVKELGKGAIGLGKNAAGGVIRNINDISGLKAIAAEYGDEALDEFSGAGWGLKKMLAKGSSKFDDIAAKGAGKLEDLASAAGGKMTSLLDKINPIKSIENAKKVAAYGGAFATDDPTLMGKVQLGVGKAANKVDDMIAAGAQKIDDVGAAIANSKAGKFVADKIDNAAIMLESSANSGLLKIIKEKVTGLFEFVQKAFTKKSGIKKIDWGEFSPLKFIKAIEAKWNTFAQKIADKIAVAMGKEAGAISGAAVTLGISEGVSLIAGGIDGLTGTKKLFRISTEPDTKMKVISTIFGALANEPMIGTWVNFVIEIINMVSGVDLLNVLATKLYEIWAGEDAAAILEKSQTEFKSEYEDYKNAEIEKQFKAQQAAGIISKDATIDDFKSAVESGDATVTYKSMEDYNVQQNKSLFDKTSEAVGNTFKAGKEALFGSDTGKTYKDAKGNTYTKGKDGNYTITDAKGNAVEDAYIDEETLMGMEGLTLEKEGSKGLLGGAKEILSEKFAEIGESFKWISDRASEVMGNISDWCGAHITPIIDAGKSVIEAITPAIGAAIKGDFQGVMAGAELDNSQHYEEGNYGPALMNQLGFVGRLFLMPVAGISWIAQQLWTNTLKPFGEGVIAAGKGVVDGVGATIKATVSGKFGDLLTPIKYEESDKTGLNAISATATLITRGIGLVPTAISWLLHQAWDKIGKPVADGVISAGKGVMDGVSNVIAAVITGDLGVLVSQKDNPMEKDGLGFGLIQTVISGIIRGIGFPIAGISWLGHKIFENLGPIFNAIAGAGAGFMSGVGNTLNAVAEGSFETLLNNPADDQALEQGTVAGLLFAVMSKIPLLIGVPLTAVSWLGHKIFENVGTIFEGLIAAGTGFMSGIDNMIPAIAAGDFEALLNNPEEKGAEDGPGGGIIFKIFDKIPLLIGLPLTAVSWLGHKIVEGVGNTINGFIDGGKGFMSGIDNTLSSIKNGDFEALIGSTDANVEGAEDHSIIFTILSKIPAVVGLPFMAASWAGRKLGEAISDLLPKGVKDTVGSIGNYVKNLSAYTDPSKSMASWDSEKLEGADDNPALGIVSKVIKGVMRFVIDIVRGIKGVMDKLNPLNWFGGGGGSGVFGSDADIENKAKLLNDKYSEDPNATAENTTEVDSSTGRSEAEGGGGFGPSKLNGSTYYSQKDSRWANKPYRRSDGKNDGATMSDAGCGPTAMAMAMSDTTGSKKTPMQMANLARSSGDRDDTGTNFNFIDKAAAASGVSSNRQFNPTENDIKDGLRNGRSMVLAGHGNGNSPFTPRGHYVVAEDFDNDNTVYIKDPRGSRYSGRRSIDSFLGNTQVAWSFNGPGGRMINTKYFGGYGGDFPTYSDLTEEELKGLANIIQHEQPGKEGHYAEASQMANLTDKNKDNPTKDDLIKKATGGWYNNGQSRYNAGKSGSTSIDSSALDAAKAVFKEGKRTLPRYVDEHDFFGDISSISTGSNVKDRSSYKKDETVIKNEMGSTYTFYTFPNDKADPFGYTDKNLKSKYKDVVWDLSTGKFTDGSSGSSSSGSGTVDASSLWVAIVKAVKKAIAEKKPGYHQAYVGCKITVGGREIEVRPDCSGLVMACLKYYGYDTALCTANMLTDSSEMKTKANFTRRSWNGWDDLKEGEVIVRNGHTEIFAKNEGGKHYVWNCGSDSSVNSPDISSDNTNYTVVWTPGEPGPGALTASDLGITLASTDATTGSKSSSKSNNLLGDITSKLGSMSSALWNAALTGDWNIDWDSVFNGNEEEADDSDSSDSKSTGTTGTGEWPSYKQGHDPKYGDQWRRKPYSGGTYAGAACGPTSMAMVISGLTGQEVTPDVLPPKYGTTVGTSDISGFSKAASDYGFKEIEHSQTVLGGIDMEKIKSHIEQGHPVILSGTATQGTYLTDHPFTSAGHYVLAFGHDGENFLINDPADGKTTPHKYKFSSIKPSIKRFHAFESSDPKTSTTYPGHDGGSTSGSTNLDATGDNAAPEIFKYLKGKGFNDIGAAGVMGCWQAESHNDPSVLEGYYLDKAKAKDAPSSPEKLDDFTQNVLFASYDRQGISINKSAYKASDGHYYPGFGLAQWTGPLGYKVKQYGETHGGNWQKLGTQLDFFWDDFSARKKGLQETMNSKSSAADATTEFLDGYEMQSPGWHNTARGSKQNQTRRGYATDIYNKYKGNNSDGGSGGGFGDYNTGTEGHDTAVVSNPNYYTPTHTSNPSNKNNKNLTITTGIIPANVNAIKVYNKSDKNNNDRMELLLTKMIELLSHIAGNSEYLRMLKDLKSNIILNNNNLVSPGSNNNNSGSQFIDNSLNKVSTNEEAARSIAYGY